MGKREMCGRRLRSSSTWLCGRCAPVLVMHRRPGSEPALRAMNWNGRYLVVGFPAGIPTPPLNLTLLKSTSIVGVFWGASTAREPELHKGNVRDLFNLYAEGKIRPRISARYKLAEGGKAIRALSDRAATGKLVVVME